MLATNKRLFRAQNVLSLLLSLSQQSRRGATVVIFVVTLTTTLRRTAPRFSLAAELGMKSQPETCLTGRRAVTFCTGISQ